jgi:hypothetical protein
MLGLKTVSTPHGHVPDLPVVARTRSGVQFDPSSERWVYRDSTSTVSLNFPHLQMVREEVVTSIKAVMLWYAENMSHSHLKNMFSHMERLSQLCSIIDDPNVPVGAVVQLSAPNTRQIDGGAREQLPVKESDELPTALLADVMTSM